MFVTDAICVCVSVFVIGIIHCDLRYKDNPFTSGDSFGSRWDNDGGSSFSSWALEKDEPKDSEVTISSIQPIGERLVCLNNVLIQQSVI